jgi:hypothetical protein
MALQATIQEVKFSYDCLIFNLHPYPARTFPIGIVMSNQLAQRMRSQQIEALKIQKEHMIVVRDRHQVWSKDPTDIEINRIRHEIIDSIEKTLAQYDQLLEALRRPIEGDK